jgi:hypothetical protein
MAGLVFIWAVYGYLRPRPRLSEMAAYGALWIGFTAAGCVLTYLAASVPRPLIDDTLGGFDLSLGFNWPVWSDFVLNHPGLRVPLMAAYGSLMPQILGSLALFALAGISGRNKEFLLNALIALLITTFVTALWPSVGPCVQFACAGERSEEARYIADVLIVRSGAAANFDLSQMQGIVTFPSYHAVLAMLLIYAHRGLRWSLSPIVAINLFMLLSIPSEGGHYVADMFGGVGVTALTMLITGVRWKKLLPPRP